MSAPSTRPRGRSFMIAVAVAFGVSLLGFVYGIRGEPDVHRHGPPERSPMDDAAARPAPSYAELRRLPNGADLRRHVAAFEQMRADATRQAAARPRDPEALAAARQERSAIRAYAGAPPVIPHPIEPRGYPSCGTCHGSGLSVGPNRAPPMSHPHLAHCTQCHAPARPQVPGVERQAPMAGNEFVGRAETSGERAWPGAPPTLPHATWMRQRCDSCHGVLAEGIHTTHPQRANCLQCHGPSARLDQWPALSRASTRAVPVRTRGDKP